MAVTGSSDSYEEEQLARKNLGVHYDIRDDEIKFALLPCYYSGRPSSSDVARELVVLDGDDVAALKTGVRVLSRRMALSMVMGVYDPLGLISAAIVKGKILLRRLYTTGATTGWDADIVATEKKLWANWFGSLLDPIEIRFPRAKKPEDAGRESPTSGFLRCCGRGYVRPTVRGLGYQSRCPSVKSADRKVSSHATAWQYHTKERVTVFSDSSSSGTDGRWKHFPLGSFPSPPILIPWRR